MPNIPCVKTTGSERESAMRALGVNHFMRPAANDEHHVVESGADRFILRALHSSDAVAYSEFIARTSEDDRRRRFPANRAERSAQRLFAPRLNRGDVAFIAVRDSLDVDEIVGEVRAQRDGGGTTAELGILVRTDFQRRGLGRALLEKMIEYCAARRIDVIGQIAAENTASLALARVCGMRVEPIQGIPHAIAYVSAKESETSVPSQQ